MSKKWKLYTLKNASIQYETFYNNASKKELLPVNSIDYSTKTAALEELKNIASKVKKEKKEKWLRGEDYYLLYKEGPSYFYHTVAGDMCIKDNVNAS